MTSHGISILQDDEGLISIGAGSGGAVAVTAPAAVAAPAAAVDEGSSLLSHDEQQEAFFADPTSNGVAPGTCWSQVYCLLFPMCRACSFSVCLGLFQWS